MRATSVWLGWRSVRHRPGGVLGIVLVLAITVALVSAYAFVYHSADRQAQLVERFSGVPLVVAAEHAEGHVPPELAEELAGLPEVGRVLPELSFPAAPLDSDGAVVRAPDTVGGFGHGWDSAPLTPFVLAEGAEPGGGEVVVDRGLAEAAGFSVGQDVEVLVLGVIREYRVSGVAEAGGAADGGVDGARHQGSLFFTDEHARELAGEPAAVLGVFPVDEDLPGLELRAAVEEALAGTATVVLTGDDRGAAEGAVDVEVARALGVDAINGVMVVLVLGTGVAAGAMGLAVRGRGREIAVLRATGAAPQQIRLMVAGEAGVLSLAALLVGVPVGAVLAGEFAPTPTYQVHHSGEAVLWAAVFVLVCAQVAGVVAAWHALRVRPSDAFAEAVTEGREPGRWRVVAGLVLLGCVFALAWAMARLEWGGNRADLAALATVLTSVTGAALVAPWVLRGFARSTRRGGGKGRKPALARANVAFHHRRFAGVSGAFLAGITLVCGVGTMQLYFNWLAGDRGVEYVTSDLLVAAVEGDGFAGAALTGAESVPGVAAAVYVQEVRVGFEEVPGTSGESGTSDFSASLEPFESPEPSERAGAHELLGPVLAQVPRGAAADAVDLGVTHGEYRPDDPGAVAVLGYFAEEHGLAVGDTVAVSGAGPEAAELRISGVYGEGHLNRPVTLGPAAAEALGIGPVSTGLWGVDRLYATAEPGAEAEAARGLADLFPAEAGFQVHGEETLRAFFVAEWAELNESGTRGFVLVGLFLALGAANAMAVAQLDRGREFASLRALGVSRSRIHSLVAAEVALTLLVVLATAVLVSAGIGLALALGAPGGGLALWPGLLPVAMLAGPSLAVAVLAVAGALLAVRSVLGRADRDEERRG